MSGLLRAGQVADAVGINVETLRYYERRGILSQPDRSPGGHRLYPEATVTTLRVIRAAQNLGFTLQEVVELLDAGRHRHGRAQSGLRARSEAKLAEVEQKIADLQAIRHRRCSGDRRGLRVRGPRIRGGGRSWHADCDLAATPEARVSHSRCPTRGAVDIELKADGGPTDWSASTTRRSTRPQHRRRKREHDEHLDRRPLGKGGRLSTDPCRARGGR